MKTIKARVVALVLVSVLLLGAAIMFGMYMAYQRNVALITASAPDAATQQAYESELFKDMAANRNRAMIMAGIFALLMAGGIILVLNRMVFRRIDKVIDESMRFVGGDHQTPIVRVRDDEIGKIETALEQFRVLFVDAVGEAQ